MSQRKRNKFEVQGERKDGKRTHFYDVGSRLQKYVRDLFKYDTISKVHVYISYPNGGPQRRYQGFYNKGSMTLIEPA